MNLKLVASGVLLLPVLIFCACTNIASPPKETGIDYSRYQYLKEEADTIVNVVHVGDTIYVHESHPGGTAYFNYEYTDSGEHLKMLDKINIPGNPNEMGGGEGNIWFYKALDTGMQTIKLIDRNDQGADSVKGSDDKYYRVKIVAPQ